VTPFVHEAVDGRSPPSPARNRARWSWRSASSG